jgi:putative peptidoglycan lipid II flippase
VVPATEEPDLGAPDLGPPDLGSPELDSRGATVRNAAVMSVGTLLSRATGIVRVTVTLTAIGTTNVIADSYFKANTTPNIVYELILGGILTSVFVPLLVDWRQRHGDEEAREAGSRFLTLVLVVLAVATVVAMVAAPWIMRLYLVGVSDPVAHQAELEAGTFFLRWFLPQIVFYGIGAVAAGILTANRRFAAPMYAPVLNNAVVIATMLAFLWMRHGDHDLATITSTERLLLAAGTTFGVVAMTLALWPPLRAIGFRWRLRFDWRHATVRRLLSLARWVALYVIANQVAYFFIILFNGRVGLGAYAVYSQAFIFFSLPHAIVAVSIFTALLPGMSARWSDGAIDEVRGLFSRGVRDTEIVMLPAAAGMLVLAGPIVALFASYGVMNPGDTALLGRTLAAFAVGLPFFSAFQLLTRTFYATQDARTPALVNVAVAVVNLAVDAWLAFGLDLGLRGLALGFGASYVAGTVILSIALRGRLAGLDGRRVVDTLVRTLAASALTALAAWGTAEVIAATLNLDRPLGRFVQVVLAIGAGVLAFALGALIFQIQEADEVWRTLVARVRR